MAMNIKPDAQTLGVFSQVKSTTVSDSRILDGTKDRESNANQGKLSKAASDENRVAGGLSSSEELQAAKRKAIEFSTTNREAPFGRLSATISASGQRDIPLGQIIDIRV